MYCTGEALPGFRGFLRSYFMTWHEGNGAPNVAFEGLIHGGVALSFDLPDRVGYTFNFLEVGIYTKIQSWPV